MLVGWWPSLTINGSSKNGWWFIDIYRYLSPIVGDPNWWSPMDDDPRWVLHGPMPTSLRSRMKLQPPARHRRALGGPRHVAGKRWDDDGWSWHESFPRLTSSYSYILKWLITLLLHLLHYNINMHYLILLIWNILCIYVLIYSVSYAHIMQAIGIRGLWRYIGKAIL